MCLVVSCGLSCVCCVVLYLLLSMNGKIHRSPVCSRKKIKLMGSNRFTWSCLPYISHINELLGSLAIALPGFGIMLQMNYDHALLLLLALLLCMIRSFC
jgi:hypothetical protein